MVLGCITLTLGVVGIFVPLLPTTPFLLLSAWLYCKGSPKLYGWLMAHPVLGGYIRNYRDKRAITLRTKIVSLALLWGTILFCIFYVVNPVWLKLMLSFVLIGVTWHLASFRTIYRSENMTLRKCRRASDMPRIEALMKMAASESVTHLSVAHLSVAPLSASTPSCAPSSFVIPSCAAFCASSRAADSVEFFLLRSCGRDVGYIVVKPSGESLRIEDMYLLPDFRGVGHGLDALIFLDYYCGYRGLTALSLSVEFSNSRAAAFYRKHGFCDTVSGDRSPSNAAYINLECRTGNVSAKAA